MESKFDALGFQEKLEKILQLFSADSGILQNLEKRPSGDILAVERNSDSSLGLSTREDVMAPSNFFQHEAFLFQYSNYFFRRERRQPRHEPPQSLCTR